MFDLPSVTRCAILECRRLQAEPLLGDGTVRRRRKQRRPCRLSSDAPPTSAPQCRSHRRVPPSIPINPALPACHQPACRRCRRRCRRSAAATRARSEEHTSELQSLMRISYAVFCLNKKNKPNKRPTTNVNTYNDTHLQTRDSK